MPASLASNPTSNIAIKIVQPSATRVVLPKPAGAPQVGVWRRRLGSSRRESRRAISHLCGARYEDLVAKSWSGIILSLHRCISSGANLHTLINSPFKSGGRLASVVTFAPQALVFRQATDVRKTLKNVSADRTRREMRPPPLFSAAGSASMRLLKTTPWGAHQAPVTHSRSVAGLRQSSQLMSTISGCNLWACSGTTSLVSACRQGIFPAADPAETAWPHEHGLIVARARHRVVAFIGSSRLTLKQQRSDHGASGALGPGLFEPSGADRDGDRRLSSWIGAGHSIRPRCIATCTASVRLVTPAWPDIMNMVSDSVGAIINCAAISPFLSPLTIRTSTSRSRAESASPAEPAARPFGSALASLGGQGRAPAYAARMAFARSRPGRLQQVSAGAGLERRCTNSPSTKLVSAITRIVGWRCGCVAWRKPVHHGLIIPQHHVGWSSEHRRSACSPRPLRRRPQCRRSSREKKLNPPRTDA